MEDEEELPSDEQLYEWMTVAVDEVLGGWEIALDSRGGILPHRLKRWDHVQEKGLGMTAEEIREFAWKRAGIAAKHTITCADRHTDPVKKARALARGMKTVLSWHDGTNKWFLTHQPVEG